MATSSLLTSSFLPTYLPPLQNPTSRFIHGGNGYLRSSFSFPTIYRKSTIRCSSIVSSSSSSTSDESKRSHQNRMRFLQLSTTMTVIWLPLAAVAVPANVSEKKQRKKKSSKTELPMMSPEEARLWTQDLPDVEESIPYTGIVELKSQEKLKHIIGMPSFRPKVMSEAVLIVRDDSRVFRTVLPPVERDSKFWEEWDRLGIGSLCVKAFTPPLRSPAMPKPFLGFLLELPDVRKFLYGLVQKRKEFKSQRVLQLERVREELRERGKREAERLRQEKVMLEKAARMERAEERRRKRMAWKDERKRWVQVGKRNSWIMSDFWKNLARDKTATQALGVLFFYLFYRFVVLNYKKQKKDYDDRLKIEQADAEERRKMKLLEKEMEGIADVDEVEMEGGEENLYLKMAKQFMKSGAKVRRAKSGKVKVPQYMETGLDVKFSDVAGLGKIRIELEEVVKFFTEAEMYRKKGIRIPGGILLSGPPGVGKTLLAKAVAGEAGVNFFSISASQFVEIYVGVGASRVRALYQEARDNAPSVVFIDELDAVGRERGLVKDSGGQERDATLNQLLVCLDGFEGRGEVITIAATNRPDILDPALVRPGRFDRKINIPKPGIIGRVEILKVHARKKPMADDVDYEPVASLTEGRVGAELANIIEIAAINMMREGRSEIGTDDLIQAAEIDERGFVDKKERSPEMWRQLALSEAAIAVVAVNFPETKNIEFITIKPRPGKEVGYVRHKMDGIKFQKGMLSRQSLLDDITILVAPRAADEIWYGFDKLSTIWVEACDHARAVARSFILGGFSEKYFGLSNFHVPDTISDIDMEASQILNMCYQQAKEILQKNKDLMNAVVDELVIKKSLTKEEFFSLVKEKGCLDEPKLSIIDIRNQERSHFLKLMAPNSRGKT